MKESGKEVKWPHMTVFSQLLSSGASCSCTFLAGSTVGGARLEQGISPPPCPASLLESFAQHPRWALGMLRMSVLSAQISPC